MCELVSEVCVCVQEVQQGEEQACWSRHSDPVLSLIEMSQEEREEVYPVIHMEHPLARPSQTPREGTEIQGRPSDAPQTGYKPQTSTPAPPQEPEGGAGGRGGGGGGGEGGEDECTVLGGFCQRP